MTAFVVTTSIAGISQSRIWNGSAPLTLGNPLRWVIEKTPQGVRARDLSGRAHQVRNDSVRELDSASLASGATLKLPLFNDRSLCELQIRPVRNIRPAYGSNSGDQLNIFTGFGASISKAEPFLKEFIGKDGKNPVFSLKKGVQGFELTFLQDGVRTGSYTSRSGQTLPVAPEALLNLQIFFGSRSWHFGFLAAPESIAPTTTSNARITTNAEDLWFLKALRHAAIGLSAILLITWFWPAPKPTDELIPAQFTKIVLARPATSEPAAPAGETGAASRATPVEKAAVVQAFRAKALRNSINGLLKGGMTRLLAQSDFAMGARNSGQAKRLFDSRTNALQATGAEAGLMNSKDVQVASIGGAGAGGSKVGYGKGGGASVAGQGTSHVSLDLGGSNVEDGLSKEEVGEVIHRHLSEVRYCYESAMLRTPGIEGRLIVNFLIGGSGSVLSSEVKSSTLPDPRLDDCILRRLGTWKFPATKGAINVAVSYPFIFKTLGR
ncbi:MAG: hypothetical protein A2X94_00100 [Bdellovibrionales bacterium GWB1_55_8]|nr:MAG: hypothetical protein A2X94_00100 [Bdellovibrionales bacterium GWB1_55_8]